MRPRALVCGGGQRWVEVVEGEEWTRSWDISYGRSSSPVGSGSASVWTHGPVSVTANGGKQTRGSDIHQSGAFFSYILPMRSCTRSGCQEKAHISLAFQYATSVIWIDHLHEQRESHIYELCSKHWQRFAAPTGWNLDDRRRADVLPFVHRLAG